MLGCASAASVGSIAMNYESPKASGTVNGQIEKAANESYNDMLTAVDFLGEHPGVYYAGALAIAGAGLYLKAKKLREKQSRGQMGEAGLEDTITEEELTYAKNNFPRLIERLDEEELMNFALKYSTSKESKKIKDYTALLQSRDAPTLRAKMMKTTNPYLKTFITCAQSTQVLEIANNNLTKMKQEFIAKNLSTKKKKGKKETDEVEFDKNKAAKFVSGVIDGIDNNAQHKAYLELALFYHNQST